MSQKVHFAYLSGNSFLNVPKNQADRPYAIVGVPYDGAVTNRPGARFGPDAIRRASHMLCDGIHPHFDVSPLDVLTDLGDMNLPNTALEAARSVMEKLALDAMQKHHVLFIGGDHSITLSLLRAQRKFQNRPLALIHFDAHCDTWKDHFAQAGVSPADIQSLAERIDGEELLKQRTAFKPDRYRASVKRQRTSPFQRG